MANKKKRSVHVRLIKHLREWHRQLGIVLAFFMIFLALTGIFINHSSALNLNTAKVHVSWILDQYQISAPETVTTYPLTKNSVLNVIGKQVWLDKQLLVTTENDVVGAGLWQQFILIATQQNMYLYNSAGELVDVMDKLAGIPTPIESITVFQNNNVVIQSDNLVWQSSDELYSWQQTKQQPQRWLQGQIANSQQTATFQTLYRSQLLSWERVILDIHSGRFFSNAGVLFMDLVALFIIVLSLSGVYMWIRQARARR